MYFKPTSGSELSEAQLDTVRKGLIGLLWKVGFGAEFIQSNCDELLATAHLEYVRALAKGIEIEDPVAWTIHVAWRRTQNLLTLLNSRPQEVSSEKLTAELIDEAAPTPEQVALDVDRGAKVRRAVEKLDKEERQLLALSYFGGKSVREAGRFLNWHSSKVQRRHESALRNLRKILAVDSSDELQIEVGLVAWLSFAATGSTTVHLPPGFEAALDNAGHGATSLWARAQDLARRFNLGGSSDAAGAMASSGAGRAIGVCATTVAVACFAGASGIVGPGVGGGIGLPGGHDRPQASRHASPRAAVSSYTVESETPTSVPVASETSSGGSAGSSAKPQRSNAGKSSTQQSERLQVREQTSGVARAASESATTSSTASSASVPSAQASSETSSAPPSSSSSSGAPSAESTQAKQQFGAFK